MALYNTLLFLMIFTIFSCSDKTLQPKTGFDLSISNDGHYLLNNKSPFFWMGDTGWLLFTLSPDDTDYYFRERAKQGFNVIQMMVMLKEFSKTDFTLNYYGEKPFISLDPIILNEAYFSYIDKIVEKAEDNNLILVMFTSWGPALDQIFSVNNPDNAFDYGYKLGERYKSKPNVVWSVCGEYHKIAWDTEKKKPDSDPDEKEIYLIESLAKGIKAGCEGKNLMTIHPDGWKSSSDDFHTADWLDFNMIQSYSIGAGTENDVYEDYIRLPHKPTILAEPGYEFGGAGHRAFEIRYEGYHSVLNGGFGFTYGCQGVWNFEKEWKKKIGSKGANQMKFLRRLFESRPALDRVPAPDLPSGNTGNWVKKSKITAAISRKGDYAFIYFPNDTSTLRINIKTLSGKTINAWWYNPRDGNVYTSDNNTTDKPFAGFDIGQIQSAEFNPPGNFGLGKDWVLVLDDAGKNYTKP